MTSMLSLLLLTPDRERPLAGGLPLRSWLNSYHRTDAAVLQRLLEPNQYTSLAFGKRLRDSGIVSSMGSVGDAYDNAAAESFIATLKSELLHRYSWPTRVDAELAIFDFVEVFYNRKRRHTTIGMTSPADFERRWYEEQVSASLVKS